MLGMEWSGYFHTGSDTHALTQDTLTLNVDGCAGVSPDLGFPSLEAPPTVIWELSLGPLWGLRTPPPPPPQGTCWLGVVQCLFWPHVYTLKCIFSFLACLHFKNNCQHLRIERSRLLKRVLKREAEPARETPGSMSLGARPWPGAAQPSTCSVTFPSARPQPLPALGAQPCPTASSPSPGAGRLGCVRSSLSPCGPGRGCGLGAWEHSQRGDPGVCSTSRALVRGALPIGCPICEQ